MRVRHVEVLLLAMIVGCTTSDVDKSARREVRSHLESVLTAGSQDSQQQEFDAIVNMGCAAVPELIAALGDQRTLPVAYLKLGNTSNGSFEAFRQYGPETITDAAAAILNQLTGQHFGFIYNGGTPEERRVYKGV